MIRSIKQSEFEKDLDTAVTKLGKTSQAKPMASRHAIHKGGQSGNSKNAFEA